MDFLLSAIIWTVLNYYARKWVASRIRDWVPFLLFGLLFTTLYSIHVYHDRQVFLHGDQASYDFNEWIQRIALLQVIQLLIMLIMQVKLAIQSRKKTHLFLSLLIALCLLFLCFLLLVGGMVGGGFIG